MADNLSAKQRSACMRAVKSQNTSPEIRVRQVAHSLGYRYSLHRKNLPGKPDLVFVSRRKIALSTAVSGTCTNAATDESPQWLMRTTGATKEKGTGNAIRNTFDCYGPRIGRCSSFGSVGPETLQS
jgi:hypothetical protein